jgi:O-antigen ligase
MQFIDTENKTNVVLLLLMTILGLTAVLEAEYSHQMVYYSFFFSAPLAIYYLLKGVPGNSLSLQVHLPLIVFLIFSALSLLWTINVNETLGELNKLVLYATLYFLTASYLNRKDVKKLIVAVIIIGTFIALMGILLFLFVKSQRITSVFNNPNPFGMYLAMLSLAGMGIYLYGPRNRWLAFSLVVITSALVLTGSRGSLLSYTIAFPILFFYVSRHQLLGKLGESLVILLITAFITFILTSVAPLVQSTDIGDTILNIDGLNKLVIRDSSIGSSSVVGRLSFWQVAWNMAMAHPFTGMGLGTYHIAYNLFRMDDKWWSMFAHNNYLQIWAETGVFSLLSFLFFFLIFFIIGIKRIQTIYQDGLYRGLLAACIAFLLHIFVDFTWNMPAVTIQFWVLMGSITALQSDNNFRSWRNKKNIYRYAVSVLIFLFLIESGQQFAAYSIAQSGDKAQNQQDYHTSNNKYKLACKIFPYRSEYYGKISENYFNLYIESKDKEDLEQSISFRKKAIELSPYDYKNYGFLGWILWKEGMTGAEDYLKQSVKLCGFKPLPYKDMGYYYLSQKKWTEAEQVLLKGLEQSVYAHQNAPSSSDKKEVEAEQIKMHLGLAAIYHEQRLFEKEKEQLQEVLKLDPENSLALQHIGNLP